MRCSYCDTPRSWVAQSHGELHLAQATERFANPVDGSQLHELIDRVLHSHSARAQDVVLAITGGEPLQQAEFLQQWLPSCTSATLLETAGIWSQRLQSLLADLDFVSLDIKDEVDLREGAERVDWRACLRLLAAEGKQRSASARRLKYWSKVILTENTTSDWLRQTLHEVAQIAPASAVYLQPVTPAPHRPAALPMSEVLARLLENQALGLDLRVLPQIHPLLEIR